jgi:hypothetical protein
MVLDANGELGPTIALHGSSGRLQGEDSNRRNAISESVVNILLCHADAMLINPFCMAHLLACPL